MDDDLYRSLMRESDYRLQSLENELKQLKESKFSRFELIDPNGRQVVHYGQVEISIQDEGRTLKVFTKTPIPESKKWT